MTANTETVATTVNPSLVPAPKGPTAAESLAKQKAADKARKPIIKQEKTVTAAPAKKAPAKATKTVKAEPKKVEGLRKPQIRLLEALKKAGKPLSRAQAAEKAEVDQAACVEYIGSSNPEIRKSNDAKHFPSLISLGLVKHEQHDIDGKDVVVYSITAKGKEKLEKAAK